MKNSLGDERACKFLFNTYCVVEEYLYLKLGSFGCGINDTYLQRVWYNGFNLVNKTINKIIPLKNSCYNYNEIGSLDKFDRHFKHYTVTATNISSFIDITPSECECGCDQVIKHYRKVQHCEYCYHKLLDCRQGIILKDHFIAKNFPY